MRTILTLIVLIATSVCAAGATTLPIALHLNKPQNTTATLWPITLGVPFAQGVRQDVTDLGIIDNVGQAHPADADITMRWRDGSVKWARFSFVADLSKQYKVDRVTTHPAGPQIAVVETDQTISIDTGAAQYTFAKDKGCFTDIMLPGMRAIAHEAGDAFYLIDSKGRRAVMAGQSVTVEQRGKQHTVIRTEGDYLTDDGERTAHGVVYFHFFAGLAQCKVSHKFIVTEETLDLWFRDIGMRVAVANDDNAMAWFNTSPGNAGNTHGVELKPETAAWMVQHDYPHFGSETSRYTISTNTDGQPRIVIDDKTAGDFANLTTPEAGLAMQMPAFAQQFPTAFRVDSNAITVKFWASECGRELDFRIQTVAKEYFGHDWIPEDHKVMDVVSSGRASARTHDVWLFPHDGFLTPEKHNQFAATEQEIFTYVDPAYITTTGAIDPVHPYDPQRFPRIEEALRDYFVRNVIVSNQVFPNTGYLAWGRNPYTSQGWELKDGKWYPTLHRHGRFLEYNLRRCSWILFLRSGDRLYHDQARRYTRFLGDFAISNWDTNLRPKGWYIQGTHWHSPAFWGGFDEAEIRADKKPHYISSQATLGYGTSEDVIQHVYDWFCFGDYHSRDAAQSYKDAVVKEIDYDMDKMLDIAPTYVILRPVGSALEIDPDEKLYNFMHDYLKLVVGDGSDVVNNDIRQNYVKSGEVWAGFYHYYISTGDTLALEPLYRAAERYYRTNRIHLIYRGSGMPQAFAMTYDKTGDPAYLTHLRQAIVDYATQTKTMADRGLDWTKIDRSFGEYWGHDGAITTISPVAIGIPMALRAMVDNNAAGPRVPLAIKPAATPRTHLLVNKTTADPIRVDLYINNFGDLKVEPTVHDLAGQPASFKVIAKESHTVGKPHGDATWQHFYNTFNGSYGSHLFYQLQIDAPPGQYQINTGDQTAWSVLYSDAQQVMQVAPHGVMLEAHHKYYFNVNADQPDIRFFAHRPVKLFKPDGNEVTPEKVGRAQYKVATAEAPGVWRMESDTDSFAYRGGRVGAFVCFDDAPMVLAMDNPSRLFEIGESIQHFAFQPPAIPSPPADGHAYTDGRFDQALHLDRNRAVELTDLPADAPHNQGTIEFWYRPHWSTTDLHFDAMKYAIHNHHLLRFGPVLLSAETRPLDGGRSANYLDSCLTLNLLKADGKQEVYPVKAMWQAGRWYHIALTWHVDGKMSDVEIFIDGRKKTYGTYRGAIPYDLGIGDLAPSAKSLTFGAVTTYSYMQHGDASFDALRISRAVRYTDNFTPPDMPPTRDGDTYLLMSFDGEMGNATVVDRNKLTD